MRKKILLLLILILSLVFVGCSSNEPANEKNILTSGGDTTDVVKEQSVDLTVDLTVDLSESSISKATQMFFEPHVLKYETPLEVTTQLYTLKILTETTYPQAVISEKSLNVDLVEYFLKGLNDNVVSRLYNDTRLFSDTDYREGYEANEGAYLRFVKFEKDRSNLFRGEVESNLDGGRNELPLKIFHGILNDAYDIKITVSTKPVFASKSLNPDIYFTFSGRRIDKETGEISSDDKSFFYRSIAYNNDDYSDDRINLERLAYITGMTVSSKSHLDYDNIDVSISENDYNEAVDGLNKVPKSSLEYSKDSETIQTFENKFYNISFEKEIVFIDKTIIERLSDVYAGRVTDVVLSKELDLRSSLWTAGDGRVFYLSNTNSTKNEDLPFDTTLERVNAEVKSFVYTKDIAQLVLTNEERDKNYITVRLLYDDILDQKILYLNDYLSNSVYTFVDAINNQEDIYQIILDAASILELNAE